MKNLGINFYHFLPTHLSTILMRKHGLISKSTSKRYSKFQYFFRGSFVLFLFQLTIEQNPIYKSKNYHSTVVVINFFDYHKGKIETKARFLGMRPERAAAVLTVAMVILAFYSVKKEQTASTLLLNYFLAFFFACAFIEAAI